MKYFFFIVIFIILVTACSYEQPELGQSIREIQQTETTDDGYFPTNNPGNVRIDQLGEDRNRVADKHEMKQAAERVPSVTVESINIENNTAHITVIVNEPMNHDERSVWSENIKSAIRSAVPYYQLEVTVK